MAKPDSIVIAITFIGNDKEPYSKELYSRVLNNEDENNFPSTKEFITEMNLLLAKFNVDETIPGTSNL